ncbi:MAG: protein kinase [Verrucomicrobiales bacterium]|nr:protein kinase [Verrucomicrobiales bacterium]
MSSEARCPECGAPSSNPGAACRRCLLAAGLEGALAPDVSSDPLVPAGSLGEAGNVHAEFPWESVDGSAGTLTVKSFDRIGNYRLLQQIGEGGFGIVYMAEQREPVRRRVAIKIVKLGMDTKAVVARFEAERQALALMDHPHIAKVLDAGATEAGRPYFVMELVRGIPITEYCDREKLPARQRLELLVQVAHAVQHAHQKGIVHRDLKPSNILVGVQDGAPVPKVIDFGIAKAVAGQELTDKTLFTAFEQFMGTPAYMSPEQAETGALDIDTRSDIYSLGVLMYELLAGRTPFETKELLRIGMDRMRAVIRETEPPRPSARISTMVEADRTAVAERRRVSSPALIGLLRGDLDWIVMRCLEKDRNRRYSTANALAADIQRHLSDEPVVARPQSGLYRLGRSVRRNRATYVAGLALFLGLAAGILMLAWTLRREHLALESVTMSKQAALLAQENEFEQRMIAEQRLYDSLLSQALAIRAARPVGYRDQVVTLVKQARALNLRGRDDSELRDAVVGCLGDFVGLKPVRIGGGSPGQEIQMTRLDPSGQLAAFGFSDGSIVLRRTTDGVIVASLAPSRDETLSGMEFDSHGMSLVTLHQGIGSRSSLRGQIRIWSNQGGGPWREQFARAVHGVYQCLPTRAGVLLAVQEPGDLLSIVDVLEGGEVFRLDLPTATRSPRIAISWNRAFAAVATRNPENPRNDGLDVWELGSRQLIARLDPGFGVFIDLAFSPDEESLCGVTPQGAMAHALRGDGRTSLFKGWFQPPTRLSFVPGDTVVALPLVQQNSIRLWNWTRNVETATLEEPFEAREVLASVRRNVLLTSGRSDAQAYRLDGNLELVGWLAHDGGVPGAAFSPDGLRLVTTGKDERLRMWDSRDGRKLWESAGRAQLDQCVAFSPRGKFLASAGYHSASVRFWDAESGRLLKEIGNDGTPGSLQECLRFSGDGQLLAACGDYGIRVWKVEDAQRPEGDFELRVSSLPTPENLGWCRGLMFGPGGRTLVFTRLAAEGWELCRWEIGTATIPSQLASRVVGSGAECTGFVPGSEEVFVVGADGRLAGVGSGGRRSSAFPPIDLRRPKGTMEWTSFTISGDGNLVAINAGTHRAVEIWNLRQGTAKYSLPKRSGTYWWSEWAPDSRHLALCLWNGEVEIWDLVEVDRVLREVGLE